MAAPSAACFPYMRIRREIRIIGAALFFFDERAVAATSV